MKKFIFFWVFPLFVQAAPDLLSTPGVDASSPQIGMDQNANVIVAWVENGFVKSRSKLDGQNWEDVKIASNSGASCHQIIVDLDGNATAVWLEGGIVNAASKTLLGSWGSSSALSSSGASAPQIAVDDSGNIVVVWIRNGNVESATKLYEGSWPLVPDVILSTQAGSPKVSVGADGSVIAVWHGFVSTTYRIYTAAKNLNGAWSLETLLSNPSHNAINPDIGREENGNAWVVWFRYDQAGSVFSNVYVQSSYFDGAWASVLDVSDPGICDPSNLKAIVRLDKFGNVIIVWNTSYDGSNFSIGSRSRNAFLKAWYPAGDLTASLYSFDFDIGLYLGAAGDAKLAYQIFDPMSSSVQVQIIRSDIDYYRGNLWSGPAECLSIGGVNVNPRVATTRLGTDLKSAVVWQNYNGSYAGIYAEVATEDELQPPTNLAVVQNQNDFGIFTEFYNTVSWDPSPSAAANGYVLYRNGVLIGPLAATQLEYVDHNRGENEEVLYQVATLGLTYVQSKRVVFNFPP